jgi:hypothetical protein
MRGLTVHLVLDPVPWCGLTRQEAARKLNRAQILLANRSGANVRRLPRASARTVPLCIADQAPVISATVSSEEGFGGHSCSSSPASRAC